jgi:multidrug resistance protein
MDSSEKRGMKIHNVATPSPSESLSGDVVRKETGKEMNILRDEDTGSKAPSTPSSTPAPSMHDEHGPETPQPRTRASSIASTAHPVERTNRRGLFGSLAVIVEISNPYHYPRRTKWMITTLVAIAGMAAPLGSAIVMPVLLDISHNFHSSATIANLNVAIYMLSMSIFPLWWSSFSETLGRRSIYLVSFVLFVLFGVLAAVSTSMPMLIVMRVLSGGAAASVQAVGAGTIADIWEPKERGKAMGLFYLGPLCGPLFAPIIGGAMGEKLGWRSTQWFLVVYGVVMLLGLCFLLPETLAQRRDLAKEAEEEAIRRIVSRSNKAEETRGNGEKESGATPQRPQSLTRISTRQSVHVKTRKYATLTKRIFIDPLLVLGYLKYPAVALTVYYASITFGSLYFLNISIQQTFSESPYNFSTLIVGLLYVPNSLGYMLASFFGGRWIDMIMHREAKKAGRYDENGKLVIRPEDRMRENAWIAAVMWPGALIWYGWTAEKGVFWFVPVRLHPFRSLQTASSCL